MTDKEKPRWTTWGGSRPPSPPPGEGPADTGPPGDTGRRQPEQTPPPRNGLGITALILGIIGVLTGIIPILFWMAAVLGIIALVLGLTGARRAKQGYATNRRMSFTGATLGGLAIVLSIIGVLIVNDAFEDLERELGTTETTAPATPGTSPPPGEGTTTPATPGALDFNTAQRYEDGLQVTVSAPRPFSPSDTAAGHSPGNRAVTVEVTVRNGSEERLNLDLVSVEAKDADGRAVERIFDNAKDLTGGLSGTLLPGRQSVAAYAFDLPREAASSLDVEVRPGFDYESAVWSGPTH